MSRRKVQTLVDSFTDENGEIRNFVIAAISVPFDEYEYVCGEFQEDPFEEEVIMRFAKGLKVGWAICNPVDIFSEDLGIRIAIGRAEKNSEFALVASQPGFINTKMVQAFLEQEAEFFKANPQSKIKGYKRKK